MQGFLFVQNLNLSRQLPIQILLRRLRLVRKIDSQSDWVISFVFVLIYSFCFVFCLLFSNMEATFERVKDDTKRVVKYCKECRHIIVVLRHFPLEIQLAMDSLYKKALCGFISIYLDFRMIQYMSASNKEAHFNYTISKVFFWLGDQERTWIWNAIVTSHILSNAEILRLLVKRFVEETKEDSFSHDEYIRMVYVLHVFFAQCKRDYLEDDAEKVLQLALLLKYPSRLCKWMCKHYFEFGWKGLSDESVHKTLISQKQSKYFFEEVYQAIHKDDALKHLLEEIDCNGPENSSFQSLESFTDKESQSLTNSKESDNLEKSQVVHPVEIDSVRSKAVEKKVVDEESAKDNQLEDSVSDNRNEISSTLFKDANHKSIKALGICRNKYHNAFSFLDDDTDEGDSVTSSPLSPKNSRCSRSAKAKRLNFSSDSEIQKENSSEESVNEKSGDDEDRDQTINGDEAAVETKIAERGDHDETYIDDKASPSGKRTSSSNEAQIKKLVKKIRLDQYPETSEFCASPLSLQIKLKRENSSEERFFYINYSQNG